MNAQAHLNLRWTRNIESRFSDVVALLMCIVNVGGVPKNVDLNQTVFPAVPDQPLQYLLRILSVNLDLIWFVVIQKANTV